MEKSVETPRFSFFQAPVKNVKPLRTIGVVEAYKYITSLYAYRRTCHLRELTEAAEQRTYKAEAFDYVTFSGTFTQRAAHGLTAHSGLLCIDLDHLGLRLHTLRSQLCDDPRFVTELAFVSPSGDGLKWVVRIDLTQADHPTWFRALQNYLRLTYGVEADPSARDVARACYLPSDASCYVNPAYHNESDICPF